MQSNLIKKLIFNFLIFGALSVPQVGARTNAPSSYQLIEQAYQRQEISYQEKLMAEVQSIRNHSSLPESFRSTAKEPEKCATEIILEVKRNWDIFSPQNQETLKNLLSRPDESDSLFSPGGFFKIHYNITGANAVPLADTSPANGIPDFVEWLAAFADSSFRAEITGLGQLVPPSDGVLGGDSLYDIYTDDIPYYGYTQTEGLGPNPWDDAYSFIVVNNDFLGFPVNVDPEGSQKGAAKVTVAHEFYHAIQVTYDYLAPIWFMEESSVWMEDYVYGQTHDNYNFLPDWFNSPDYSLATTVGNHMYAGFIWPRYLVQKFGSVTMPQIWNQMISTNLPYAAIGSVLSTHGTTLEEQYSLFSSWNFITGTRDDGTHYADGVNFPLIFVTRSHGSYPVVGQTGLSGKLPDAMGNNYLIFNLPPGPGTLKVDFSGDSTTTWKVRMLPWKTSPTNHYADSVMTLSVSQTGSFKLRHTENWSSVVMVVTNVSQGFDDRNYLYGATFTPTPDYAITVNAAADALVYSHSTTSVKFRLANGGAQSDNFLITVGDKLGWNIHASRSSIVINPDVTDSVSVIVNSPALLPAGVMDTIWLKAASTSDAGVFDVDSASVLSFIQPGDADNSGNLNISDAVYLISYVFAGGPAPVPVVAAGDANCDTILNISDVVFLIQYIFSGGPPPPCKPF